MCLLENIYFGTHSFDDIQQHQRARTVDRIGNGQLVDG